MYWEVMAGPMGWGILEEGWRKGPWTAEEDRLLIQYVNLHGEGRWNSVARFAGLKRNGKSCRLRWVNYLRPDLKRGQITPHEERIILELHARWGNRWSTIARSLPGRTDNEIKNYWRTHFKKKAKASSEHSDKSKTKLLRRQNFQQQKQQQQQQQQQQQNQIDIKRIMTLFDENDHRVLYLSQMGQDLMSMYPYTSDEQWLPSSMSNHDMPTPEASSEEIVWDGLWNLDDVHDNLNGRTTIENLVTPYC